MSDIVEVAVRAETCRVIGQQWVRFAESPDTCVAIRTTAGWLALAEASQVIDGPRAGKIVRRLLRLDELPTWPE